MMADTDYWMASRGTRQTCGMMPLPQDAQKMGAPPHWLPYIAVSDINATAQRAQSLGGQELVGPTIIPNMGAFAVNRDPTGGVFAYFEAQSAA